MDSMDNPHRRQRASFLGLLLAVFFGSGGLLFLVFVTGGFFLYVLAAMLAIVVFGYAHYLLWGHALTQEVAGEREEEEARDMWDEENPGRREEGRPPRRF